MGWDEIITIKHGEDGYFHTDKYGHDRAHAQAIVDEYSRSVGVAVRNVNSINVTLLQQKNGFQLVF